MRPSQLRPTPHSCVSGSHLLANTIRLSISSAKPSLFRSEPCNAPCSSVLTPVFSHSCELFCASQKAKSFTICNFRTLSPKHPGVGYPHRTLDFPIATFPCVPLATHRSHFDTAHPDQGDVMVRSVSQPHIGSSTYERNLPARPGKAAALKLLLPFTRQRVLLRFGACRVNVVR